MRIFRLVLLGSLDREQSASHGMISSSGPSVGPMLTDRRRAWGGYHAQQREVRVVVWRLYPASLVSADLVL
jgi:hypothetical protein